jgi:hypothetical protein
VVGSTSVGAERAAEIGGGEGDHVVVEAELFKAKLECGEHSVHYR